MNMRLLKTTCFAVTISIAFWGCSSGTGPNENEEPTEYSFSVSASPSEAGSVDPAGGSVKADSAITVEAIANEGWAFVNWTGDQESDENPLTFNIDQNIDLTANFEDQRSVYLLDLDVIDAEDTLALGFGQREGGTDSFDNGIDEEAPPAPPEGALNAYFDINDLDLFQDYRSNTDTIVEWTLQYQVGSGEDLKLEWSFSDETQIEGSLVLTDSGGSFEVDMQSESSHTITGATSGSVIIQYAL